jgi:hypothetical protein
LQGGRKAWASTLKKAGLPFFPIYNFRHTFATRAVASGADLPTLSALLGHASILMTMRYVHPAAEQKRLVMEKFEKFRAEGIIGAATTQQGQAVTTKSTTLQLVHQFAQLLSH